MKRVRITNRKDGMGLVVTGLEAAKVRRVVLVADPLVPPRVFLELLGQEVDIDLAAVVVAEPWPPAVTANEARRLLDLDPVPDLAHQLDVARDLEWARAGILPAAASAAPPPAGPCLTCGGPHGSPPPPGPTPLVSTPEDAARERERRAAWCRSHGGRS